MCLSTLVSIPRHPASCFALRRHPLVRRNSKRTPAKAPLSLLSLALTSVLSSCAPGEALGQSSTISADYRTASGYQWRGGDLLVDNGVTVSATAAAGAGVQSHSIRFGTLTNNGGTVTGVDAGILNFSGGSIAEIDNRGSVVGGNDGIHNAAHIGRLVNSGTIAGGIAGLVSSGAIDSVNNAGLIQGGNYGITSGGAIGTINNSGSIVGNIGIHVGSGTISVVNNTGLIGGVDHAIAVMGGAGLNWLNNAGTIAGDIIHQSSTGLAIQGGTGSVFGTFTGASGNLDAADVGMLTAASDVRFVSGNLLLNDHIDVGSHRLINTAANLQINQRITINGDYQQDSAAALLLGVADGAITTGGNTDSGYGQLLVNGNAYIAAGSTVALVRLNSYAFAPGQRFVAVLADSADYHADMLQYGASGFNGVVTGSQVDLNGKQSLVLSLSSGNNGTGAGFRNAADNRHAVLVLDALYRYSGIHDGMLGVYNPALALDDTPSANRGGSQLTPVAVTSAAAQAARTTFMGVFKAAVDRIDQARSSRASGISSGESTRTAAVWSKAFGGHVVQSEHDEAAGYHSNFHGLMMGADMLVTQDWRAGALLSRASAAVANDGYNAGSSVQVNSTGISAYAGYDGRPWYVNVMAGVARQQFHTTRAISFAGFADSPSGSFNGFHYLTSVQTGYPLTLDAATRLTPLAGVNFSMLRQNAYVESGGAAALTVQAAHSTSLKSELGVRLERSLMMAVGEITPALQLGWRHEFHESRLRSDSSFIADASTDTDFFTTGVAPIKDTVLIGVGLVLAYGEQLSLAANYAVEAASGYTSQSGDVRLRWQF